jgi:hypothetical protein
MNSGEHSSSQVLTILDIIRDEGSRSVVGADGFGADAGAVDGAVRRL